MQKRLFRSSPHSVFVDTVNENFPFKVEKGRHCRFYLPRRHHCPRAFERKVVCSSPHRAQRFVASGLTINFINSLLSPTHQFEALGLEVNVKDGYLMVQAQGLSKRGWKASYQRTHDAAKNGRHLGPFSQFAPCFARSQSLHRSSSYFRRETSDGRLGHRVPNSFQSKGTGEK